MAKKIKWSSVAYRDFTATLKYYTDRNKNTIYSRKLVEKVDVLIKLLIQNPELGRQTDDPKIRVFIKEDFKIFL